MTDSVLNECLCVLGKTACDLMGIPGCPAATYIATQGKMKIWGFWFNAGPKCCFPSSAFSLSTCHGVFYLLCNVTLHSGIRTLKGAQRALHCNPVPVSMPRSQGWQRSLVGVGKAAEPPQGEQEVAMWWGVGCHLSRGSKPMAHAPLAHQTYLKKHIQDKVIMHFRMMTTDC